MRLPRLLDGSMGEIARLHPSRLSATINLSPLSTAEMVLPSGEPSVSVRQWVEIYKEDDSLGVFRVASVRTSYGDSQTVSLEHGVTTLEDCITPEDTELTGSFREILGTILGYQAEKRWQLGTVDVPDGESYTFQTSGDLCLQALISLMEMVRGYGIFFDQTTSPWTLHVRKLETVPSCECRMSRNINDVSISLDESQLVTRVVSPMLPGGYMDGPTVGAWGVIARPLSIDSEATEAEAVKQATEYLDVYQSPAISVEIDALELANLTGESLDAFTAGKLCRTALPDFGVTVNERVNTLYYEDLLLTPSKVRLTLATAARTTQQSLAGIRRSQETTTKTVYKNSVKIIKNEKDLLVQAEQIAAQAKRIDVQAEEIAVKADKILLDAYVKITELEAEILTVLQYASVPNLIAGNVIATDGSFSSVGTNNATINGTLKVAGNSADWQTQEVVTSVSHPYATVTYDTISYTDASGNAASKRVVTSVSQVTPSVSSKTLRFVGAPVV